MGAPNTRRHESLLLLIVQPCRRATELLSMGQSAESARSRIPSSPVTQEAER